MVSGLRSLGLRQKRSGLDDDASTYSRPWANKSARSTRSYRHDESVVSGDASTRKVDNTKLGAESGRKKKFMGFHLPSGMSVSLRSRSMNRRKKKISSRGRVSESDSPTPDEDSSYVAEQRRVEEESRDDGDAQNGEPSSDEDFTAQQEERQSDVSDNQKRVNFEDNEVTLPQRNQFSPQDTFLPTIEESNPDVRQLGASFSYEGPTALQSRTFEDNDSFGPNDKYHLDVEEATVELKKDMADWSEKKPLKDPSFAQESVDLKTVTTEAKASALLSTYDYLVWSMCNIQFDEDDDESSLGTTTLASQEIRIVGTNPSALSMDESTLVDDAVPSKKTEEGTKTETPKDETAPDNKLSTEELPSDQPEEEVAAVAP